MKSRSCEALEFSYPVTRPYPQKWFTPVVIVSAVIFATLFSLLNFATNGYELSVTTSSDYNATTAKRLGISKIPAFLTTKIDPTCQPADIPVNSQLFTNQSALRYTLLGIWQEPTAGPQVILPSLTYSNNVLENCTVTSIGMDLESTSRTAVQVAYIRFGVVVNTYATCTILTPDGPTFLNITNAYEYVPASLSHAVLNSTLGTNFLERNATSKASLWWGESLMSFYWAYFSRTFELLPHSSMKIQKGSFFFTPNTTNRQDITKLDFFDLQYQLYSVASNGALNNINSTEKDITLGTNNPLVNSSTSVPPKVDPRDLGHDLAKAAFSTVMTDLGQTATKPNILLEPNLLEYFTANFTKVPAFEARANAVPGPSTNSYDPAQANTDSLGTTPSVISTKYLCQVPMRKPAGTLVWSIFVADLVLLQAVWIVFTWFVGNVLMRKLPQVHYCEGCAAAIRPDKYGVMQEQKSVSEEVSQESLLRPRSGYARVLGGSQIQRDELM